MFLGKTIEPFRLFWFLVISFCFFRNGKCLQARFPKISQANNILFRVS